MTKLFVAFIVSLFVSSCVLDSRIANLNSDLAGKTTDRAEPGPGGDSSPAVPTPAQPVVSVPKVIKKISVSDLVCASHDQGMDCWGNNYYQQVGTSSAPVLLVNPLNVFSSPTVDDVAVGAMVTCIVVNGGVQCSGAGWNGLLGNGSTTSSAAFVTAIAPSSGVTAVSAGFNAVCAIKSGGLFCWGAAGFVGDGTSILRSNPVQIFAPGSGVTKVSSGNSHMCAIVAGEVWCWG